MISVRKQEFIDMFLPGLVYFLIGFSGYLLKSNLVNGVAFILAAIYSLFKFTKRSLKKQKDDDDSLQNKHKAGYTTFFLALLLLLIYLGIMIVLGISEGTGLYTSITWDLNTLCLILGMLHIVYFIAFMRFDRTE